MARSRPRYVVCLDNRDYRASLVVRRIYASLPDADAESRGLIRVIDESEEDYLFPADRFAEVELSPAVRRKLAESVGAGTA